MAYLSAYPRPGEIALLCEGDLIGYEATLFQKWTGAELGNAPLVDIWPCGTSTSIRGISDAIGRSRPIFVIEDRDFRSVEESRDDCARNQSDRERRGVRVIAWSAWIRCEIENYLLDPAVLLPVFQVAFGCDEGDIIDALEEILPALAPFQAAQYAISRARRLWSSTDPAPTLLAGVPARPTWNDEAREVKMPDGGACRTSLEKNVETWIKQVQGIKCDVVADFDSKLGLWKNCGWTDDYCRADWAGKEILHWLRVAMTSRFGWPINADSSQRQTLIWAMSREKREAQDRPIEAALRPRMIDQLLSVMPSLAKEIRDEFSQIRTTIKSYQIQT
jgi:hypothetical protein